MTETVWVKVQIVHFMVEMYILCISGLYIVNVFGEFLVEDYTCIVSDEHSFHWCRKDHSWLLQLCKYVTNCYSTGSERQFIDKSVKACPHCRRKVRLSHKSETVTEKCGATALFCDSLTLERQCGQGFTHHNRLETCIWHRCYIISTRQILCPVGRCYTVSMLSVLWLSRVV